MEIDSFDSSSSEDPHLSILKSMPLRMRTQVMLANPRRFGSGMVKKKSIAQTQNMIEEMSESESVDTFTSSSSSSSTSDAKKSLKKIIIRKASIKKRPQKRSQSFVYSGKVAEEHENKVRKF